MHENENPFVPQDLESGLAEIDRILHQMLLLAEFSSQDLNMDRAVLQKTLDRLRGRIDRIADAIERS